jgi:antitoxin FitA
MTRRSALHGTVGTACVGLRLNHHAILPRSIATTGVNGLLLAMFYESLENATMATLVISLPEDRLRDLEALAQRFGLAPEELVRASIEELIAHPREDFIRAAEYVLKKNQGLYRRLA